MKRTFRSILAIATVWALAGCVSIDQNVAVNRMTDINPNQNPTLKCAVKNYPCLVIRAQGASGSIMMQQGPRNANDQASFDSVWTSLTVDPSQSPYSTVEGTNKPMVDWNLQQAFFLPVGQVDTTCRKIAPVKVESDCLTITIYYSVWTEKGDCKPTSNLPVFVYIFPKTVLPIGLLTTEDADGDGFSNDTEIKLGTNPADPQSHP